ncbi:hypothetical protein ACN9ML_17065 [Dyadobacter endophyticus]|uniref:Uncharacterized protein n=1 Tax=Dyadobacter endophyticus TaxID=1749036 RepID=A0ABQ1Z407_9BACT|nr:hypothetical protein [Dyadobacter endophyticus]GGH46275.1 hypothetical protein GCM10007423_45890 [Dyadobacter endophyticus]
MKDSERISNLEEMLAEILMRLDRVDAELVQLGKGQSQTIGRMDTLEENMRDLAKHMFRLNDRQTLVEETMRDISATNRIIFERMATKDDLRSMATKDDLAKLFEFMMDRFDKTDARFDDIRKRLDDLGR